MEHDNNKVPYISLYNSGELEERADRLNKRLESCDICPRQCGVNRLEGERGYCNSGKEPIVASYCDHHGEEPAISGTKGSGTIFFGNCNLECVFCQNHQISQNPQEQGKNQVSIKQLVGYMLELQEIGCHNINLVSPTHFIPQIMSALVLATRQGLALPIVYNTNSYDSFDTLRELDGVISIYLPDMKYADDKIARKLSGVPDYTERARRAVVEMWRQVGELVVDKNGVAIKGVLVRHLVLPGEMAGSRSTLEWLAENVSHEVGLSLMSQYYPCHRASGFPEIARPVTKQEYLSVLNDAKRLGFTEIFAQQIQSNRLYLPDFNSLKPFGD